MAIYAYLFEARGIQRFLFSTGKLKDMIQGSELIDYICANAGYVDQVLQSLGLKVKAPRKAGGAFYLIFDTQEDAERFQSVWRIVAKQWFPSVECVDVLSSANSIKAAIGMGLQQLAEARNQIQIELPNASPITERNPRTGMAAIMREFSASGRQESIDIATASVRKFKRPDDSPSLVDRFLTSNEIHWPNNFEATAKEGKKFPLGKRSLVGLVHADGNGLGEILRLLNKACRDASDEIYIDLYQTFSSGITAATVQAAQQASQNILLGNSNFGVMPARPLVLGGDDLSVIIRADLAIPFTQAFLVAFKETSKIEVAKLKAKFNQYELAESTELPDYLTACAGIVFMKASQPFYSAYKLSEGLCKQAKNYSRQYSSNGVIPSSLAFYKVNDSVLEDIDAMYDQTQIAQHTNSTYHLSVPAYFVDEKIANTADLEQLLSLEKFLKNSSLNDRALREIATLIHANVNHAKQVYKRWNQYSERQVSQLSAFERKQSSDLEQFKFQLQSLIGNLESDLPFHKLSDQHYQSVLGDLLTLFTISEEVQQKKNKEVIAS